MTKKQKDELVGFSKAKRLINDFIDKRIEVLKINDETNSAKQLSVLRNYIRNYVLYKCGK